MRLLLITLVLTVTLPALAAGEGNTFLERKKKELGSQAPAKPEGEPAPAAAEEKPAAAEIVPEESETAPRKAAKKKKKPKQKEAAKEPEAASAPAEAKPAPAAPAPRSAESALEAASEEAADRGFTLNSSEHRGTQTLAVRAGEECYAVEFELENSEAIPCTEPLAVSYTRLACKGGAPSEKGKAKAIVACENQRGPVLHFRTKEKVLSIQLRVIRNQAGRKGAVTRYTVEKTQNESKFTAMLPEPEITPLSEPTPEEKPIEFKVSGFMTVEYESSQRFGYDVGDTSTIAAPNFNGSVDHPRRSTGSLFSNINFSLKKDQTTLQSILEVGEVYSGDSATGGAQGARASNLIEMRNLYLEHTVSDSVSARAGLITVQSDPRSFIYNDHTAVAQVNYTTPLLNGSLWYGNAQKNRPAATSAKRDDYLSLQGNLNFLSGFKNTLFFVSRHQANATFSQPFSDGTFSALSGDARSIWLGGTFETSLDPFTAEFTFIHNNNRFTPAVGGGVDSANSYLADAKLTTALDSRWSLSGEGLVTPGAASATDSGNRVLGRRKAFSSPVGAAYLMTVATNDGVDDAPGTPKQSTIANLGQDEGLRMGIGTLTFTPTKKWTTFVRGGKISTDANSAQGSKDFGSEIDFGAVHQLTPSSTVSVDFGQFQPGAFFKDRSPASLFSLKYKYSF